jgi:hypothetical protein
MQTIYFGGSRSLQSHPAIQPVISATLKAGHLVHVGCQNGADRLAVLAAQSIDPGRLCVFCVANQEPAWVLGAWLKLAAGGPASIPLGARYLRRSMAAFQNCAMAVFFEPGAGSFAVMREFVKQYPAAPVFVFSETQPAPRLGGTFETSKFGKLACWQFLPKATPAPLF